MLKATYIFLIVFFSLYFEVLCGSFGLFVPFTAFAIFYFSITYSLKLGIVIGFIAGAMLDILYGRGFIFSPFLMASTAILAHYWLYQGEPNSPIMHFLPGAGVVLISVFPLLFFNMIFHNTAFFYSLNSFMAIPLGAFILPFFVTFLDFIAFLTELPQYRTARKRSLNEYKEYK